MGRGNSPHIHMKIKYVGIKSKMTLTLPLGCSKGEETHRIEFKIGQTHDFEEEEGQKLLDLDKEEVPEKEISHENLKEDHKLTQNVAGYYTRQRNFIKVEEEGAKNEGKEEEKEETGILNKIHKLKKRFK